MPAYPADTLPTRATRISFAKSVAWIAKNAIIGVPYIGFTPCAAYSVENIHHTSDIVSKKGNLARFSLIRRRQKPLYVYVLPCPHTSPGKWWWILQRRCYRSIGSRAARFLPHNFYSSIDLAGWHILNVAVFVAMPYVNPGIFNYIAIIIGINHLVDCW